MEAQAGDSPDSQSQGGSTYQPPGFEQFVGEWYRHGEALTIDSDRTGSGVSRIYSTPSGEVCPPDRSKCNVKFELSFTPTNNGIDAEVTSTEDGEYSDLAVGDTYSLKLVEDNLLRQSNRDEVGGYWCNSQTSEANYECGA